MMKINSLRIFLFIIVIGSILIGGASYIELRDEAPLKVTAFGFQENSEIGDYFMLLENYGKKNIRISSVKLNGEKVDMDLCHSHIDGSHELEHNVCGGINERMVPPTPTEVVLENLKNNGNSEVKPYYTLWYSKTPAKGDEIKIRYYYGWFPLTYTKYVIR